MKLETQLMNITMTTSDKNASSTDEDLLQSIYAHPTLADYYSSKLQSMRKHHEVP